MIAPIVLVAEGRRDYMKRNAGLCLGISLMLIFMISITAYAGTAGKNSSLNQPPISNFTYSPASPMPGDVITFDASASYDPDGYIILYTWDFGDGNNTFTTSPTVTHSYPIDADYTVELVVTDNSGANGASSAIVQVSTVVFFRTVFEGSLIPMSNVQVTLYYFDGSSWTTAPVGPCKSEIKYDNLTQPNLANSAAERYRNPGFTASILRQNASNIGFDVHPSGWKVYFKFQWGPYTAYWPNETTRVYTYKDGNVETHDYLPGHRAYWDASAGTYVIKVNDIPGNGVSPTDSHPIIVGILCPPTPKYYLTVKTDPAGITTIPGEGWYNKDTNVTLTAPSQVAVSGTSQYRFNYWDVDGSSRGSGVNPITVQMNSNHTATAHYVLQYLITFAQAGLSTDATGTVVTVDGSAKTLSDLPCTKWVDNGATVTYSYNSAVTSSTAGKRYRLSSVTGPASPITVSGPVNVTGNFVTQYLVTFAQTGLDSTAIGTVVTVNGTAKTYTDLPFNWWVDSGCTVTYTYSSTVSSSVANKQFRLTGVNCPPSPFIVTGPVTITGNYCCQYKLTFNQTGLDSSASGTVVTVNGAGKVYSDLPYSLWVDSGGSVTYTYSDPVLSTTGKRFRLTSVTGSSSPITVSGPVSVTGNFKTQYQVTFDESGVGPDFSGTVLTVDSTNYNQAGLPVSFWWDSGSSHNFAFTSPLTVNASKQYVWNSTSGLSTLQSGTITVTGTGSVVGNYFVQNSVTFDQLGISPDYTGTIVTVDDVPYTLSALPKSFFWQLGTTHTFAFQSPLVVTANGKQYLWTSTSGLSTLQNGSITVTTFGSIIGNYKTQYYLNLATSPLGVTTPSGSGWYDAETYASISTDQYKNGNPRYSFVAWSTQDMSEITNPSLASTTVFVDKAKTVTANYIAQYQVTFSQSGVGSDFTGTVVTIDGVDFAYSGLPVSFWYDNGSSHTFAYQSPLTVTPSAKAYVWTSTTGLSTAQSGTLAISSSGTVTGNYKTQYYLTVTSAHGSPTPTSGWFDSGASITASVNSPVPGPAGTRYVCTGWSGTGSVPPSGSGTTVTFQINAPSTLIWNWNTQYYLTVLTDPSGLVTIPGEGWYDATATVTLTAPPVTNYDFVNWDVDGVSAGSGVNPITVTMNMPHAATAHYHQTSIEPLTVSISPLSATIHVGQSATFQSTVNGGVLPYSYQWYVNGQQVPGATAPSWAFTPSGSGVYYVYLTVTDGAQTTAQSETARVDVISTPVGGYSVSAQKPLPIASIATYIALIGLFGAVLSLTKRKRK